jgi:hypothetical protein
MPSPSDGDIEADDRAMPAGEGEAVRAPVEPPQAPLIDELSGVRREREGCGSLAACARGSNPKECYARPRRNILDSESVREYECLGPRRQLQWRPSPKGSLRPAGTETRLKSARAGNRRRGLSSALRAHTEAPYIKITKPIYCETLRALNRPGRARTDEGFDRDRVVGGRAHGGAGGMEGHHNFVAIELA